MAGITLLKDKKPILFIGKNYQNINHIIIYNQFIIDQCKLSAIEIVNTDQIPNEGLKGSLEGLSYMI